MGNILYVADWVLAVLVLLCFLAHLAVLRAPDIPEKSIIERIRMVKLAGLLIMTIRFFYVMSSTGDILMPLPTQMGLTLLLAAELYGTLYRLFPSHIQAQQDAHALRCAARRTHSHATK